MNDQKPNRLPRESSLCFQSNRRQSDSKYYAVTPEGFDQWTDEHLYQYTIH